MTPQAQLQQALEYLEEATNGKGCCFWACPGPDKPVVHGATCITCSALKLLRSAVASLRQGEVIKTERFIEYHLPETDEQEDQWLAIFWPGGETASEEEMLSHVPDGHEYRIITEVTRRESVTHGRKP